MFFQMGSIHINFKVDSAKNCPAYDKGTAFTLHDNFLKIPGSGETCLVLARKMTEILMTLMAAASQDDPTEATRTYTCGGCSGLIKFSQNLNEPQSLEDLNTLLSQKNKLLQVLSICELFQGIDKSNLVELIVNAEQHSLAPKTVVVKKGTKPKYVFMILAGTATVIENGTQIAEINSGQLFGEMSFFCDQPAFATVVAKTNLEILIIPNLDFRNFIRIHESIQDSLVRRLVKRLEESNKKRVLDYSSCMRGRLSDIGPAELLQTLNMHQLTGILKLMLEDAPSEIIFKAGEIVSAQYEDLSGKEALYAVVRQKEGTFLFSTESLPEDHDSEELGDFMMLIMEATKQADEQNSN